MIKKNNSTSIKNLVDKAISFYNKKEYSKSLNIYFPIFDKLSSDNKTRVNKRLYKFFNMSK